MTEVPTRRPQGAPCWVSLMVRSLPVTQEFYSGLFGWEFQPGPRHFGPYVRATLDGRMVAGIGEAPRGRRLPIAWTTYLSSPDADATAELIRVCGGTVAVGPLDADDEAGRMVIAADPSGAVFGVWQPGLHPGLQVSGEPGSLAWSELVTREAGAVAKFYTAVFGYESEATGGATAADHLTLRLNGRRVAGVHGVGRALPADRGAHWMTYFAVADPDAAAARVVELGGRVLDEPADRAFGRQATVADVEGAVFTVIRPTAAG
ncbi:MULTISPECIES: VOC family protein [Streptomycetaceae]|uniref:VOC domain-containing protein n=1 Tax=Streptantibioticus cattleyicolor (strain ATCC 35852 / DSM 46488 / JCM 4925 / NBRC 14057 / NRRL 8057) TaxID=1003195 RepID=F8JVS4_STREN|nr:MULTISPECIES: VOC family protein [Streptomycetaceae]AEW96985.1 hypothetical protein SCATT_46140 [Streptantibioticus cattleyicolor NRRL 8057 = DSM 46488]MYS61453.1 VOC family protein [Streptomyces sp. SID5468]CCB77311.1 conserved protein of unknown function [Streptantibioticus cattleyicolor NRRL 8057 = DSM 46488]